MLMEAATWWIQTHQLNYFEKAQKIKIMAENGLQFRHWCFKEKSKNHLNYTVI